MKLLKGVLGFNIENFTVNNEKDKIDIHTYIYIYGEGI